MAKKEETYSSCVRTGGKRLQAQNNLNSSQGEDNSFLDARLLMCAASGFDQAEFILRSGDFIPQEILIAYEDMLERRARHEPIAYIIGYKDFWKGCYAVTPDVLIPRPDSECLIETVCQRRDGAAHAIKNILDLGTGSGCLLSSLLGEYPMAYGIGIDRSEKALKVAQNNLHANGVGMRGDLLCASWFNAVSIKADIIIANPPYISLLDKPVLAPDIMNYEPHSALFSANKGQYDYDVILRGARDHLSESGLLVVEIGDGHETYLKQQARSLFPDSFVDIGGDLSGLARVLTVDLGQKSA